ncbi:hypothetical protein M9H77_35180 [Catharanthus roseus]|uniref:Uncharacterized protein n=1 Tax=Catharanthus roseus TaxID=4058 RepID=A0ACB9ZNJ3_CATRO|nr:hypothetical protein M9H77_35180 [Catharanthus roseus]
MQNRGIGMDEGFSKIRMENEALVFLSADRNHRQADETRRGRLVLCHSEKLAWTKENLLICEDCYNFMKLESKVFYREIIYVKNHQFYQILSNYLLHTSNQMPNLTLHRDILHVQLMIRGSNQ